MLKPEQIPDEVVDAAVAMRDRGGSMSDIIRTAINAWPGMKLNPSWELRTHKRNVEVILPLSKEPEHE